MPETIEKEVESKDKTKRETKAMWVPWGVTTFEELEQAEVAQEAAEKMSELTWNFQDLVWNILNSSEVDDKAGALRQLGNDFADRVGVVSEAKSIIKNDLKQLNGESISEKIVNVIRKATGADTVQRNVVIYKDQGGTYRWVGRYSNCYRDDDNPPEIISEKSHQKFVKLVDAGLVPKPTLWIWHQKALEIGQADWVAYDDSGFALAGGHIYPGLDEIAENLKELDDMAMSHGMPKWSIERDEKDNSVITQHITDEISLLPESAAANKRTGFVILDSSIKGIDEDNMAIPVEKRDELVKFGIKPELLDALEAQNSKQATEADLAEVERKDEAVEEVAEPVEAEEVAESQPEVEVEVPDAVDEVVVEQPQAIVSALQEAIKAIVSVNERLEGVESELKELKRSDAEKVAQKASSTSLASMSELLSNTVIGNSEARIDGRTSLGKSAPKEADPEPASRTGIPMIDGWLSKPAQA